MWQVTVAGTNCCSVEQTPQGSGLGARLASISAFEKKLIFKPSTSFSGMVNSSLHMGHTALDPGRLPLQ